MKESAQGLGEQGKPRCSEEEKRKKEREREQE